MDTCLSVQNKQKRRNISKFFLYIRCYFPIFSGNFPYFPKNKKEKFERKLNNIFYFYVIYEWNFFTLTFSITKLFLRWQKNWKKSCNIIAKINSNYPYLKTKIILILHQIKINKKKIKNILNLIYFIFIYLLFFLKKNVFHFICLWWKIWKIIHHIYFIK